MTETAVTSFVVRFIQEDPAVDTWRGLIRHVQTSQEIHFSSIKDALLFMDQFVKIEQPPTEHHPQIRHNKDIP
ncbi:MAG: hypothetical protein CSB13_02780 [Chloroflexi bacterium]|nr:MAG: hypothetical protein CSB13_02780 [Chloroflexota bacterium]